MNRIVARACRPMLSSLLSVAVVLIAASLHIASAQQKDGDGVAASSNSSSSGGSHGPVNFNIIQLLNGEYLEMFGTGTTRGILRGHPTTPGIELGSLSADPLFFSTNSVERMRILSNGFVGIGTNAPGTPLELFAPDANPYLPASTTAARVRFVNSTATPNNAFEIDLAAFDTNGAVSSGARLVSIFTSHTPNATSADFAIGLRNVGVWAEMARFTSTGRMGIGTSTPAHKLDVAGTIRSSTGGFVFPDGTVQLTASFGGGGGGTSQWTTSGANIFYNAGNVGLGTTTPGVALDVSQGRAIRVGNANLSSGGDFVHLGNHAWYTGSAWQLDGSPGGLYQINGQQHTWYTHNGAGSFPMLMTLTPSGNLGIGTIVPTRKLELVADVAGLSFEAGTGSPNSGVIRFGDSSGWKLHFGRSRNSIGGALNSGTAGVLMTVQDNGNIGIGTTAPGFKLEVAGTIRSSSGGFVFPDGTVQTTAGGGTSSQWTTSGANVFYNSGNVGIGTASPSAKLHVAGVDTAGTAVFGGSNFSSHFNYNGDNSQDTYIRGGKTTSRVIINDAPGGNVLLAQGGGNVGVGTGGPTSKLHVVGDGRFTGNLTVDGNLAAKYQDLAEWVPAAEQLSAGTVVVLDATTPNQVTSSSTSYDTRVAGVISEQPGIALGEKGNNKVLVATTGRVKVKVDATHGPIQIGDLLVTSNRAGFAMKSLPVEIGATRLHRPGTLIGKALEPLATGTGEILVLLSLQ
jgi:hypothetical protein